MKPQFKIWIALIFIVCGILSTPVFAEPVPAQDFSNPIQALPQEIHYYALPLPQRNSFFVRFIVLLPLFTILIILGLYVLRHYIFAMNRLFGIQHNMYAEIIDAKWPTVTILVAAHNEESVIGDLLSAVLEIDYPPGQLKVIVVNDRSTDETANIVEKYVAEHPHIYHHFHRKTGTPGKGAALRDAMELVKSAIILVFDADYLPGSFLIKQLVSPFFDPEVGAVMGRVVAGNTDKNLLTRLIDMERCGGYQVNQQARENLHAIPQYGGTAGGIRMQALDEAGGWDENFLAEDTEITFRFYMHNWISVYQNNAECHELVPETWPVRIRQIKRWTKGHNQVLFRYLIRLMFKSNLKKWAYVDGIFLLCLFMISPLLLLGWILYIIGYFLDVVPAAPGIAMYLLFIGYSGIGNFTIFFEISTAIHLDNLRGVAGNRVRLLPLSYLNFFVSMFSISMACIEQLTVDLFKKKGVVWRRTDHPSRKE